MHEDMLNREPQKEAERAYRKTVNFYARLSTPLKVVYWLLVLIVIAIVFPFSVYAAYETWRRPAHRMRLLHAGAVFCLGLVSSFLVFYVLNV
jgi:hypothetical protein